MAVFGPSGRRNPTIFRLTIQLLPRRSGEILVDGKSIDGRRGYCGYMPQRDLLFPWRTVNENLRLPMEIRGGISRAEMDKRAAETREHVGLAGWGDKRPEELSGGMRQRAALIRTLALNPDILLLDEPFSALDYQTRLEVSDDIGKIIKEQKKAAILVSHDISEAISMGDSVVILSHRPAHIKKVVNINLSIPDRTPFTSRQAPEFAGYFNEIWEDIQ